MPISKNIKIDYGAKGDGQRLADTVTSSLSSTHVTFGSSHFVAGDVGKMLVIGSQGGTNIADTIAAVDVGGAGLNLTSNAAVAFSGTSQQIEWGSNERAPFVNFNAAFQGQTDVNLVIPAGRYCFGPFNMIGIGPGFGIPGLTLTGDAGGGTILSDMLGSAAGYFLGTSSVQTVLNIKNSSNAYSSKTATVAAGASSVTLLTSSESSRFAVSTWALMAGYDLQGFGDPINCRFFEYVFITAIDSVNGIISFSAPLKYAYKSTWPTIAASGIYGGPATLFALDTNWNATHEYIDLQLDQYLQTNSHGKSIKYTRGSSTGFGIFPSLNLTWEADNFTYTQTEAEIDKMVDHAIISGGTWHQLKCQSASINLLEVKNVAFTGSLNGSTQNAVFSGCTFAGGSPGFGPIAYGGGQQVVATNCTFASEVGVANGYALNFSSISNGVVNFGLLSSYAGVGGLPAPGDWLTMHASRDNEYVFQLLDVYTDGTNVFGTTNLPNNVPPMKLDGTVIRFLTHGAPKWVQSGCNTAYGAGATAAGRPLGENWKSTLTGNFWQGASGPQIKVFGKLVSMTVAINTPYNGANSPLLGLNAPFVIGSGNGAGNLPIWNPRIDLKQGPRTVTITLAGHTGAAGNDATLDVPDSGWTWLLSDQITGQVSASMSDQTGNPVSVTVEINTDQGVVISAPSSPPHRKPDRHMIWANENWQFSR